jgi:hypothetical protein
MTPTWHAEAQTMKAADPSLSNAEIGRRLGVGTPAVWKALHPELTKERNRWDNARRRPEKREWDRQWAHSEAGRGRCANPACGNLRGIGAAKRRADGEPSRHGRRTYTLGYCSDCVHVIAEVRQSLGEGMWADRWPAAALREILGVQVGQMRLRGWDLPYRYTMRDGKRVTSKAA